MNHRKIRNTLRQLSREDAEKIGETWQAPHKEQVWERIHQKLNSEEENHMISYKKNKSWTDYLGIAAGIALFFGTVCGSVMMLRQSGRYVSQTNSMTSDGGFTPAEQLYSAEEETIPAASETMPELAAKMPETAVSTAAAEIITTVTETSVTTMTEITADTLPETVITTAVIEIEISEQTEIIPETLTEVSVDADAEPEVITAPPEEPDPVPETTEFVTPEEDISSEEIGETMPEIPENPFVGSYSEEIADREIMDITFGEDQIYHVSVHWAGSAFDFVEWEFSGEFNGRQTLYYTDCVKKYVSYTQDGLREEKIEYTDGTGFLKIAEEGTKTGIVWSDDQENIGEDSFFIKN